MGLLPEEVDFPDTVRNVYSSPRRLLAIQEIETHKQKEYGAEVKNIHAMLITLPEGSGNEHVSMGGATIEYFPPTPMNYFRREFVPARPATENALRFKDPIYPFYGTLVLDDVTSPKVRRRQLESLKMVGNLPEVIGQKIGAFAGLTPVTGPSNVTPESVKARDEALKEREKLPPSERGKVKIPPLEGLPQPTTEALPISQVQAELLSDAQAEARADAIIDAAVEWVKAWNMRHAAREMTPKERKANGVNLITLAAAEKNADAQLKALLAGEPIPSPPSSSGSSSSSSAASGPAAAGAPQGGRKKRMTRRSLRKKHMTRRR